MRFTVDGSPALEERITRDMARVRDESLQAAGPENIAALVLGGGYGRGEGGVYVVDGEERVYNDYDFFVVVPFSSRHRRQWVAARLLDVKAKLEPECGIHVDFSPPMPLSQLPRQPRELMFMEARAGYHVLHGPPDVLDALPDHDIARPPLAECARLFMNRGVGLLMARMLLREKDVLDREEHEFVVRNVYKAYLAMGDSVLFLEGRYSASYRERATRLRSSSLEGVPAPDQLRALYEAAHDFKLHPKHELAPDTTLDAWLGEAVAAYLPMFRWFEQQRLNRPGLTWEEYAALPARLPELGGPRHPRNLVRNMRRRVAGTPPLREWLLHPRDRALKRLPALLADDTPRPADEALVLDLWENYG